MIRQLHPRVGEFDVFELFSTAGKVVDVRLILDDRTGKCLGVGYVEMADTESFAKGLALNGSVITGQPIIVGSSLAEKNRLAAAGATNKEIKAVGTVAEIKEGLRIYVGGLHYEITEDQLRELMLPFGPLERVDLHREPSGSSKGFGFVHFLRADDAQKCIAQMDGFELAGRAMKVSVSAAEKPAPLAGGFSNGPGSAGFRAASSSISQSAQTLVDSQAKSHTLPIQPPPPPPICHTLPVSPSHT